MEIKITHKKTEVSKQLRQLIEEKCAKLERFVKVIGEVDVVLKEEKEYVCFAEINVPIKGNVIHAEAQAGDALSAFEEALSRVEKQVKKYREKITTKHNCPCGSLRRKASSEEGVDL